MCCLVNVNAPRDRAPGWNDQPGGRLAESPFAKYLRKCLPQARRAVLGPANMPNRADRRLSQLIAGWPSCPNILGPRFSKNSRISEARSPKPSPIAIMPPVEVPAIRSKCRPIG